MRPSVVVIAVGLFAGVCSMVACDNTISPRAENAENIFAIHGYLDAHANTQLVRVSPLRATVLADPPSMAGVTVQSLVLSTSEIVHWSDSTQASASDEVGELFFARFYPNNGETYVLQVLRNDLVLASARTTVPADPILEVGDAAGDSASISQPIRIGGVQRSPTEVSISYEVSVPTTGTVYTSQKSYVPPGHLTYATGAWTFDVFLKKDLSSIAAWLGVADTDPPPGLRSISMITRTLSAEYDQSTNPSNLDNAHGFFGSIGEHFFRWTIDSVAVAMMGWEDQQSGNHETWTRSSGGFDNQFEPF